jgi:hypothetical protein
MAIENIPVQTVAHQATVQSGAFVDLSVREALLGLKNGQVTLTVHNGEIIQIDRILKKRQFKSRPHS